jgi:glycosyltransferase involved in cell wall biosynthesis
MTMLRSSPETTEDLRVLHVVAPAAFGGLERVVQTLAIARHQAGGDVRVAAIVTEESTQAADGFLDPLRAAGVPVHPVELPPRRYLRERAAVKELCRQHRPHVVHTHGCRPDLVDGGIAHSVDAASVTTVHGSTGGGARERLYESLQRRSFRWFDAVVAVSRPLAHQLVQSGVTAKRVHFVPNAWQSRHPPLSRENARDALGIAEDAFAVGWSGRISHEKGLDVLIDAFASLPESSTYLSILGDGPEREELELRARRAGIAHRITWHGFVRDADAFATAFDVFALSSRTEGTPMVLFEAIAAGVPVIATRVGGVPEVIHPDEGVLVAPDNPLALASAIRKVQRQRSLAAARAQTVRERVAREYCVEPWIDRYEGIYRAAVGRARNS